MEKQKIVGISNREDYVELILKKDKTYYPFLFNLLKKLNIEIPDIQDYMGNELNILEERDSSMIFGKNSNKIYEVIGHEKIFLFVQTELREELAKFIQKNCKFIKK